MSIIGGGGTEQPLNPNRPLVTGLSPKEGFPGTKVTIRGEKLGRTPQDLIGLEICGVDCRLTAEWFSPNKIVAKTLLCKGVGDIIVVTGSGGIGTSTVQFKGMQEASIGPHKESAVWVEETVSVGPRPLSMAAYTQEDPLQLSSEGNENKFPVEELLEFFPEGSGNLRADNFVPAWFLLENHHMTSFDDLKYGLKFLDRKVKSQTEGKLSFLKENVSSVMDQLDALLQVKEKFDNHVSKRGTGFLTQLDESIDVCEKEAGVLFQEVLTRKDRADVTRNALNGFQRFRFLFSLPGSMERNVKRGEYDNAINDYIRAKTLFEAPEMDKPIFQKFRHEIELRVQNLQETLWTKLVEKPPNSEDQRRLIGYLVTLQFHSDPAWAAIACQLEFLENSMKNCFVQFSSPDKVKENMLKTPSKSEASFPNQVLFVEALSDLFVSCFQEFWYLCLDYCNGKLHVKCEVAKQQEVKEMMTGVVQLFSKLIGSCLFSNCDAASSRNNFKHPEFSWTEDKSESMSEWLPHCLGYLRDVFSDLLGLDPPAAMLDIIRDLLFSVRSYTLEIMLHQMSLEIADLYKQETWASEPNGTFGFITQLPFKYETQILHSVQVIKETLLQKYKQEVSLLKSSDVRNSLTENLGNALAAFSDALEMLISQNENTGNKTKMNVNAHFHDDSHHGLQRSTTLPCSHSASLLLILNNCSFTKETVLPQINRSLIRLGIPDMSEAVAKAKQAINVVEKLTFVKYTEMKYEPVVGQVEQFMYSGHFDWENCVEPTNIRPYVTKTLLGMIDVIAEVSSVSEKLVSVVMTQVVENVCEELTRLFSCVPKFSEFGVQQATLDILAFQEVVEDFLNSTSRSLLRETFGLIPKSSDLIKHRKVQQLLEEYRNRTKLQYYCFASSAAGQLTVMM